MDCSKLSAFLFTEFLLLELNKLRNEVSDMKKEINELKYGSKKG